MMLNRVVVITIKNIKSNLFDNTHIHPIPTTSIALMLLAGSANHQACELSVIIIRFKRIERPI